MAIRTTALIHSHYIALQGYGLWDFKFHDISAPPRISDTTPSATPQRYQHISTSTLLLSPGRRIPGICLSDIALVGGADSYQEGTGIAAADSVTVDDTEDDQEVSSLDSSMCSSEINPPLPVSSSRDARGLGISGLRSKDGSGPFTGLGVICVRPFAWRHKSTSGNLEANAGGTPVDACCTHNTSHKRSVPHRVQCQTLTNVNTPLQTQKFKERPILECDPGSSDALHLAATETTPTQPPVTPNISVLSNRRISVPSRPTFKRFAAPTISSQLKRISNVAPNHTGFARAHRHRLSESSAPVPGTQSSSSSLGCSATRDQITTSTSLRSSHTGVRRFSRTTSLYFRPERRSVYETVALPLVLTSTPVIQL
ncbi:hypothetical protein NP233_g4420 [Leucocoprinus birnbaumii]|uniref:Uncharacterized protein n=1 Tax=Leucocoprinus birnbaumii TaxID=56174 RepID=A0AAD5VYF3_9AGAR|nr:hypothetical protein NP233_g4420 [Leucocoprinus birnbaumii]